MFAAVYTQRTTIYCGGWLEKKEREATWAYIRWPTHAARLLSLSSELSVSRRLTEYHITIRFERGRVKIYFISIESVQSRLDNSEFLIQLVVCMFVRVCIVQMIWPISQQDFQKKYTISSQHVELLPWQNIFLN